MNDAREVIARGIYWTDDEQEWASEQHHQNALEDADNVLAALSEAGLTVCGERMEADLEAAKAALSAVDHATYGWSFATAVAVIDKIRLIARSQERIQSEEPK